MNITSSTAVTFVGFKEPPSSDINKFVVEEVTLDDFELQIGNNIDVKLISPAEAEAIQSSCGGWDPNIKTILGQRVELAGIDSVRGTVNVKVCGKIYSLSPSLLNNANMSTIVESPHPYENDQDVYTVVEMSGANGYIVSFDEQ